MLSVSDTDCSSQIHVSLVRRPAGNGEAIRSVLYVDDNWEHLSTQCAMLEDAGYRVEATDSPAAGLSSYVRNGFDAVILDFHLPFVSNRLLATVLRRFRNDIPLILISDPSEFADQELSALDRQLPRDTSQVVILDNIYEVIERGHDVYDIVERGHKKPAGQVTDTTGRLDRRSQM